VKKYLIIISLGLLGWALCGAIIGIGRNLTSMEITLIIHAIGAPIIFGLISLWYFRRFNYTSPLQTAVIFLSIVIIMDAGLVAPVFEGNYDMFKSPIGTWVPFLLIFISIYSTGKLLATGNSTHPNS
jgi:hypothetical protein